MRSAPFGTGRGSSLRGRPPAAPAAGPGAADDHGRPLTTNPEAAACYRVAQRYSVDPSCVVAALRGALTADPGFALAAADLQALGVDVVAGGPRRLQAWERRHIDVVAAAAGGDTSRAAALLGEHLADVGRDPIALVCVALADRPRHDGGVWSALRFRPA